MSPFFGENTGWAQSQSPFGTDTMTSQGKEPASRTATTTFATIAKRISVWTTNCLVSVLILVVGVGFGRQVLRWWTEDTGEASPAPLPVVSNTLSDPSARHFLEFGDRAWVMSRRSFAGGAEAGLRQLRDETAALAGQAELPADEPGAAERELLQRLAGTKPAQEDPGLWHIHEFDGPFPIVVGTRAVDDDFSSEASASGGDELAVLPRRVVTWGLGIPSAQHEWTLWTFQCGSDRSEPLPGLSELPVPPGATKTLAVRVAGGGVVLGFQGKQGAESWKQFFDQWFRQSGWTAGQWRKTGSSWHLGGRSGVGQEPVAVDIQFGPQQKGGQAGLLVATPVSAPTEKDTHP